MHSLRLCLAILLTVTPIAGKATPRSDAAYFSGNWTCAGTAWRWTNLIADESWMRVEYGNGQRAAGIAVFGWVAQLRLFVYRDFHADGSYADLTTPGLANDRWTFTGAYYPVDGTPILNGRITYVVVSPTRYDRVFESLSDGALKKMGGDTCTKGG